MGIEIERKFLVNGDAWRAQSSRSMEFAQGYLNAQGKASVRVRIEDDRANLNIKAAQRGIERAEYEYPIPLAEAQQMLDTLSLTTPVRKTRHWVEHGGHVWEIDVFAADNAPLVVAEIELDSVEEAFERPSWLGQEISEDQRYYNHALAFHPYSAWAAQMVADARIEIDLAAQALILSDASGQSLRRYAVSTSKHGAGERSGSGQTPRGLHHVRARIGAGAPPGSVFVGRRMTGDIHDARTRDDKADPILSRILWLSGDEIGVNRLGAVDTMRRLIYIHGTRDDAPMGEPASAGCIRMRNADIIDLFDRVPVGTPVAIHE